MRKVRVYSPVQLLDMALENIRFSTAKAARNRIEKAISLTSTGYGDAFYEVSAGYELEGVGPTDLVEAAIHLLETSYRYQGFDNQRYARYVRRAGVYLRRAVAILDERMRREAGQDAA